MAAIDRSKIYKHNRGNWIALKQDFVTFITSGDTLEEASKKAAALGYPHPIFEKVPKKP